MLQLTAENAGNPKLAVSYFPKFICMKHGFGNTSLTSQISGRQLEHKSQPCSQISTQVIKSVKWLYYHDYPPFSRIRLIHT